MPRKSIIGDADRRGDHRIRLPLPTAWLRRKGPTGTTTLNSKLPLRGIMEVAQLVTRLAVSRLPTVLARNVSQS